MGTEYFTCLKHYSHTTHWFRTGVNYGGLFFHMCICVHVLIMLIDTLHILGFHVHSIYNSVIFVTYAVFVWCGPFLHTCALHRDHMSLAC